MKNRREYLKEYNKLHYKHLREYRTRWQKAKRDEERLYKIQKAYFRFRNIISPLLKNIKVGENKQRQIK